MRNESIKLLYDKVKENKLIPYKYMPYKEQKETKEWKVFKLYVILSKGVKCDLCEYNNINYLQVHHKEFKKGLMLWQYELKDMMVLCSTHYKKIRMPEIREKYNRTKSIKSIIDGKKIY
jgi:hypothetical protein